MTRLTTNFDAVAASAPLNGTAASVRDGSGEIWGFTYKGTTQHWKAPPPAEAPRPKDALDLTGLIMGRLTVVRFHGYSGQSSPRPVWLVRCVCGDYEVRRSTTISKYTTGGRDSSADEPCCIVCQRTLDIQRQGRSGSTRKSRRQDEALLDRLARGERP